MDLGVGEIGYNFCGKHHLLMTRIQVSDPVYKGPLVFLLILLKKNKIFLSVLFKRYILCHVHVNDTTLHP